MTPDEVARGDVPSGNSKKGCLESGLFMVALAAIVILARKVLG